MIRVERLNAQADGFRLKDIDLEIGKGEYFVLLGPTGAGKTFLIECICGLRRVESGRILINGRDVTRLEPAQRNLGYVPQDYALFPTMTVFENIAFGLKVRRSSNVEGKVLEIAEMLRITHLLDRYPQGLSGGEKQRVALGRALVIEPDALLLDEPLSALDPATAETLCRELRRVQRETGITTIHVCHNFEEMLMVADRAGVLNEGRLVQVGRAEEIFRRPKTEFVARFFRSRNILTGKAIPRENGCEIEVGELSIRCRAKARGRVIFTVRPEEISLLPPHPPPNSNGNLIPGVIQRLEVKGALTEVEVKTDEGIRLISWVLTPTLMKTDLKPGSRVYAHIDPDSVILLANSGS